MKKEVKKLMKELREGFKTCNGVTREEAEEIINDEIWRRIRKRWETGEVVTREMINDAIWKRIMGRMNKFWNKLDEII